MISEYKYIFFDVDGVLLSSIEFYAKCNRATAESLGASTIIPDEFYRKNIGVRYEKWLPKIFPDSLLSEAISVFEKSEQASEAQHFPLIDGAIDTLVKVKKSNKKIGLVSTRTRKDLDFFLKNYKVDDFIDYSISCDDVSNFKPDPEGILKSIQYFDAVSEETVFIGDSLHDLGAARNAGVQFIGVLSGVCTKKDWENEKVSYVSSTKDLFLL